MARAPLLQLSDVMLSYGGNPLFDGLTLSVQPGDRIALVGRNGAGKSTLMKVMAGQVEPDAGSRVVPPATRLGYMEQDPDLTGFETLGDYAGAALDAAEQYKILAASEGLGFDPARPTATASGGERRRAALARLMAAEPDLMLLDEPTNHLDIAAIEWLEAQLSTTRAAFVLISHDRAFLDRLTRATLWIDRGQTRRAEIGFAGFEAWRDKIWEDEDEQRHKLERKIKAEGKWAVEGISARRKRNQGRVRALQDLRAERAAMIRRQGPAAMALDAGPKSGKRVVEADKISKAFGAKVICREFSILINRADRVAFVGPNGAGKTTLLKLLTGEIAPDSGTIKLGTNLVPAVFDQTRARLDPEMSLWDSLTGDPDLRVSGKADQVMVRGEPRHVIGYLKDFLFDEARARAPVKSLSGGEKARLLLAKLMAKPSNLLILDEPTNDLDIETLDLLQEILDDYDGTVLLVSHDRDFLDRVATQTVAQHGPGQWLAYPGGWSDYAAQRPDAATELAKPAPPSTPKAAARAEARAKSGLSYTERNRLDALPGLIDRLTAEIAKLTEYLSQPDMFTREPAKFRKATEMLTERQQSLAQAEEEWLALEEKAAG